MANEFIWHSPDGATAIHVSLDVVDGIVVECMRGLGAVPKRGAEVGGILLGSVEHDGSELHITVDAFEPVPIQYKHGPSYLFSEDDALLFTETMARLSASEPRPVGFFRANTREEMELTAEDAVTLDRYFRGPDYAALLIRSYSAKPCTAGFVLPLNGRFVAGSAPAEEFQFRRREIEEMLGVQLAPTGERVPYRPFAMPAPQRVAAQPSSAHAPDPPPVGTVTAAMQASLNRRSPAASGNTSAPPAIARKRRVWWSMIPLSSIFLAVGILLGIQATLTFRGAPPDPYDLKLSLKRTGNSLALRWDRGAPAIQTARRGSVFIEDGPVKMTRDLEPGELQGGSIVYVPTTGSVHFRLQVFPKERDSVTESIDWSQ